MTAPQAWHPAPYAQLTGGTLPDPAHHAEFILFLNGNPREGADILQLSPESQ